MSTTSRKDEHIDICLNEEVDQQQHFFDAYQLEHCALPEMNLDDVDTSTELFGKQIAAPLIISSMTGGTKKANEINKQLAQAAEKYQLALGVGSQRAMIEDKDLEQYFQVREYAPTIPLFANLGAIQLQKGYGVKECEQIVKAIGADALCLHLNPLQEAIQPEGDTDWRGVLEQIRNIAKNLSVPLIVKEVGAGISQKVAEQLLKNGVEYIDVSGRGGTSWAKIEGKRGSERLGSLFANWGIPTPEAIQECAEIDGIKIIAGGGVRSGVDIAKAIALGADYASMALPLLKAAHASEEALEKLIESILQELRIAMFITGAATIQQLHTKKIYKNETVPS